MNELISVVKTCQKHMGCARNLGHDGPCMGRRGNIVPPYELVKMIRVTLRGDNYVPLVFRECEINDR